MGCQIEVTDTGIELQIHNFDTKDIAQNYLNREGYHFRATLFHLEMYGHYSLCRRASLCQKKSYWQVAIWEDN